MATKLCHAELCFANSPFAAADHLNSLAPAIVPDSKIAVEFACARIKTAALITHVLAPATNVNSVLKQPFTVMEGMTIGIMVRVCDEKLRKIVVTRFLDAPVYNIATVESFLNTPWKNVIGFALDSASVTVGKRNSVLSCEISKQPDVSSMGCVCPLAALCATAALKKLPVSIDDLLVDIYYHFKNSSKQILGRFARF